MNFLRWSYLLSEEIVKGGGEDADKKKAQYGFVLYVTSSDFKRTFEQTDSEILSSYLIRYTCNFSVYATYDRSKKMGINGIKFIIDSISYDNITDTGTIASDSVSHTFINEDWKSWEDSSGHAYASYCADLPDSSGLILDASNPDSTNPGKWNGPNLLGKIVMFVREKLRDSESE